ncbi:hypothetical protein G177_gp32 [Helicobacter phage KHP40]|uniref:Uncharacterized protein n=1 Tax=Helicobacter phage KHP40 TaxID=1204178 RepID=I7HHP8_9CAUD|nr:hypothetical protein G177_gp32 [Helicobacter phage KHP40]BAM34804.1 hypothetical protein [Helicobacter phage KHP40]
MRVLLTHFWDLLGVFVFVIRLFLYIPKNKNNNPDKELNQKKAVTIKALQ